MVIGLLLWLVFTLLCPKKPQMKHAWISRTKGIGADNRKYGGRLHNSVSQNVDYIAPKPTIPMKEIDRHINSHVKGQMASYIWALL